MTTDNRNQQLSSREKKILQGSKVDWLPTPPGRQDIQLANLIWVTWGGSFPRQQSAQPTENIGAPSSSTGRETIRNSHNIQAPYTPMEVVFQPPTLEAWGNSAAQHSTLKALQAMLMQRKAGTPHQTTG